MCTCGITLYIYIGGDEPEVGGPLTYLEHPVENVDQYESVFVNLHAGPEVDMKLPVDVVVPGRNEQVTFKKYFFDLN